MLASFACLWNFETLHIFFHRRLHSEPQMQCSRLNFFQNTDIALSRQNFNLAILKSLKIFPITICSDHLFGRKHRNTIIFFDFACGICVCQKNIFHFGWPDFLVQGSIFLHQGYYDQREGENAAKVRGKLSSKERGQYFSLPLTLTAHFHRIILHPPNFPASSSSKAIGT